MAATATRENYREVLSWLRGGDCTPNPVMEDRFLSVIADMVEERIRSGEEHRREDEARKRAEVRRNFKNPLSLRNIINTMREEGEVDFTYEELFGKEIPGTEVRTPEVPAVPAPEAETGEYDSVVIAKAFRHLGRQNGHVLNMSQIQILMYITYGLYLASTGKRLTGEHPQMWQFGPVFPRAYNKIRKDDSDGRAEYEAIEADNPRLAGFMDDQFHRFGFTTAAVASAPHLADGSPWAKTRKGSPDKWGAVMDDADISEWFTARMAK